jgi:hypothetical protein
VSDLDVLRSKFCETLQRYWQDSAAVAVAEDELGQTEAQLRAVLDRFLNAGGTMDDVKSEIERLKREL